MLNDMPIMSTRCVYDHLSPCAPPVFNLVQNLKSRFESTLNDSINHIDIMDYSERNMSVESSLHLVQTPCRSSAKGQLWDSGLGSPTPGSSPLKMKYAGRFNHTSNSPSLSPIPYSFDENNENLMECSLTDLSNHNHLQLHCDYGFSILPHTPVCQNQSLHSSRKIQFSQNKIDAKLQRSLKKMRLSRSPINNNPNPDDKRSVKSKYQAKLKGRPKALFSSSPQANFNPFVNIDPIDKPFKGGVKRTRDPSESYLSLDSSLEEQHPSKKISLREMNVCRFREEFHILNRIGDGQFGSVYKCINRLDGCVYAVKRSQKPVAGSVLETDAVNEVYAHAALSKHRHIIGYYSSWVEMDRVFIQTEYCNGGSLNNILSRNKLTGHAFSEAELSILLSQLADGLSFIHSQNLVHLDVKPDNIMVCYKCTSENELSPLNKSPPNDVTDQQIFELASSEITYKIGDFGMVTSALQPRFNEGDCRYLPKEILQENTTDIQKADIFSLSLTIFEAGSNIPMPPNGPVWQEYRAMGVPDLKEVSNELNLLLKEMSNTEPILRPTAGEVMRRVAWFTSEQKMNAQLANELEEQRKENEKLKKQLQTLASSQSLRLVGKSCCKSQSVI